MSEILVRGASKSIGGCPVLSDIDLTVGDGASVGLAGVNGSGKTMLMRALAGLIRLTTGTVSYGGLVLGRDVDVPPSLGALIEAPSFLGPYGALDNLRLISSIRRVMSDGELRELIDRVGLDPDDRRPYRKFSLGMRQRLGIAAALMEEPDVVLLDEPTNALDTSGVAMLGREVARLRERGATVILTCHDEDLLRGLTDEVWRLEGGRIIARGDAGMRPCEADGEAGGDGDGC